jgi:hypothetical protein
VVTAHDAALANFAHGGGRVISAAGVGQGALIAAIRLDTKPESGAGTLCHQRASMDRVAAARVMLTDVVHTSIQTREKRMRSNDDTFAGLLLIEGFDETSVRNALWRLPSLLRQVNRRLIEELPPYAICFIWIGAATKLELIGNWRPTPRSVARSANQ